MLHQFAQKRNAVHAGHFDVECQDIGIQRNDLVAGNIGVRRRPDDLNPRVPSQCLAEYLTDNRRVINHQDPNGFSDRQRHFRPYPNLSRQHRQARRQPERCGTSR